MKTNSTTIIFIPVFTDTIDITSWVTNVKMKGHPSFNKQNGFMLSQ